MTHPSATSHARRGTALAAALVTLALAAVALSQSGCAPDEPGHEGSPLGAAAQSGHRHGGGVGPAGAASGAIDGAGAPAGETISHYTCSMHPSVRASAPGTCPICGMDLIPITHADLASGTITVSAERRQLIGVTTGRVTRQPLAVEVRAVGRVTYDETRLTDVSTKYRGWIGVVHADYTGIHVDAGAPLFTLYSPDLLAAEEEFLESVRRAGDGRETPLLRTARRRLSLWDLSDAQIAALAAAGRATKYVPILSPATGTVIEKRIVAGSAVEPGMRLYRIADLSTVWVEADVYESDLPLARVGAPARITFPYEPGRTLAAAIAYVYPYLDPDTRTGRVRLALPNPDGALMPDMYASVDLTLDLGEQLVVPEEAIIRAGTTSLVFVDLGEGRLEPRKVTVGRQGTAGTVVLDGLAEGDVVVTAGNFLLAAESKLKSGIDKW